MDDEELRAVLEDAGLSPYQAAAYVTLLDLGTATATDVADACEVPDPRIYDVVRDLEGKGYVETYQQDCLTVRAHDPETVLADLRDRSTQYRDAAEEIEQRWSEPAVADHEVSIVTRFETVLKRSRALLADAKDEVLVGTTVDLYRRLRPDLADAVDRDVHVKLCLYTDGGDAELPPAEELAGSCIEARHRPILAEYLLVVDRQWTCFAPQRDTGNEYGVLVDDRTHTHVFHWFFRTALWETWNPLYAESSEDVPVTYVDITECLRAVVPLLEDGKAVSVSVTGHDITTRERTTVEGRIVDTFYSGDHLELDDAVPLAPIAGVAGMTIEAEGEEQFEIGGWGARLEDVEARRITITGVDEA